jgi:hypothetical protein
MLKGRGGGGDAKKHRLELVSLCGQNVNEATARIFVNKKIAIMPYLAERLRFPQICYQWGFNKFLKLTKTFAALTNIIPSSFIL